LVKIARLRFTLISFDNLERCRIGTLPAFQNVGPQGPSDTASNGGRHRQSCRSGQYAIPDGRTRQDLTGGFFVFTRSTALVPSGAQPETTMTKRIGTGASLADFTRRDFLASSVLTAALFTAALLLFPVGAKTESKDLTVASPVSLHAPMPRR
jgi:nitrate/nitrite transport system substrate-binding protein